MVDAHLRLFVAIHPPLELGRRAIEALRELPLDPHRVTPLAQLHCTLHFIGPAPVSELDAIRTSIAHAVRGVAPFTLSTCGLIALPERGAKRLVAMELDRPLGVVELKRRLVSRLVRSQAPAKTRRERLGRFRPHLTLCRFRRPAPAIEVSGATAVETFEVTSIQLMKSTLRPEGAEHEIVDAFALGASAV